MAFSETVKEEVFVRQKGRCAGCGRFLNQLLRNTPMQSIQFHHVVPKKYGSDDSALNCVALCTDTDPSRGDSSKDGCHGRAHAEYRYTSGAVATPEFFPYSHGHEGSADHLEWARRMSERFKGHIPERSRRLSTL